MKKLSLIISLLYGSTFLSGCTTISAETQNWKVEPLQRIQHATNRPDGYYRLGRFYQGQNRLDLAAEAYRKALAIDGNFSEAHNGLGTIYASQGKFKQALVEFNLALAKMPTAAHVYNNIGYLHLLEGKYAEAVAAFTRATTLDPANQNARNNMAMALAKNGGTIISNQVFPDVTTENKISDPVSVESEPKHVASDSEVHHTSTLLTELKDSASISTRTSTPTPTSTSTTTTTPTTTTTTTTKSEDIKVAVNSNSDNKAHAEKTTDAAKPAKSSVKSPFAVLAMPNQSVMPIVIVSGSQVSTTNREAAASSKPSEGKPVSTPHPSSHSKSTGNTTSTNGTTSKSKTAVDFPKAIELKNSSVKAVASPVIKSASIPGERKFVLEVSNGNGINKSAAQISSILSAKGFPDARLTNQTPFNQSRTMIHYRKGYLFEAARLSRYLRDIHGLVFIVESKELAPNTDVKLVLGKDLSGNLKLGALKSNGSKNS